MQERGDKGKYINGDKGQYDKGPQICECEIILESGNFWIEIFWCDDNNPPDCLEGTIKVRTD